MGVNIPSTPAFLRQGYWVRPRRGTARIDEGKVYCELETQKPYELAAAYRYGPHVQLLRVKNNKELLEFVQRWGPIGLGPLDLQRVHFECPVSWFWVFRDRLRSLVFLLGGMRGTFDERIALGQFLDLRPEEVPHLVALACYKFAPNRRELRFATWLSTFAQSAYEAFRHSQKQHSQGPGERAELVAVSGTPGGFVTHPLEFPKSGVASNLLSMAPVEHVHRLSDLAVQYCLGAVAQLLPVRTHAKVEITHSWKMDELRGALEWMVFMDEWSVRPIMFCPECQKPFHQENKHQRRYCSDECGHRLRARNSRRRQLAAKRQLQARQQP